MWKRRPLSQFNCLVFSIKKEELKKSSGLENIAAPSKKLIEKFKAPTGTEKRVLFEKIIHRVVMKEDNKLVIEPKCDSKCCMKKNSVNLEEKSTDSDEDGSSGRT